MLGYVPKNDEKKNSVHKGLKETVGGNISDGSSVYSCFLDMSKAFDYVNHELLIAKLAGKGLPDHLVQIFKSVYAKTTVRVCVNGVFSDSWKIHRGVRQGGITSAFLFNIYIDDILSTISNFKVGCILGFKRVNIQAYIYADDVVLVSLSLSSLQFLINQMSELLDTHVLRVNVIKTVAMIFNKNINRVNKEVNIFYKDSRLDVVNNFKYLGCLLKSDLCEDFDIYRCKLSFKSSFGFLFRKFYSVNLEVFYSLFNLFCSSFYGSELWVNRAKCSRNFKDLSIAYHSAFKKMFSFPKFYSNHFTCNVLNAFTFEHFINFKCIRFLFWLYKNDRPCFTLHKFYFSNMSLYRQKIDKVVREKYNMSNILENDIDGIVSRISFIQHREPFSMCIP